MKEQIKRAEISQRAEAILDLIKRKRDKLEGLGVAVESEKELRGLTLKFSSDERFDLTFIYESGSSKARLNLREYKLNLSTWDKIVGFYVSKEGVDADGSYDVVKVCPWRYCAVKEIQDQVKGLSAGLKVYFNVLIDRGFSPEDAFKQAEALNKINGWSQSQMQRADFLLNQGIFPTDVIAMIQEK